MALDLNKIEDETLRKEIESELEKIKSENVGKDFTQADIDREVNKVSQKLHLDEKEMERKIRQAIEDEAKLSAEEKASARLKEVEAKEVALRIRENTIEANAQLIKAGIDVNLSSDIIEALVSDDSEVTNKRIESFIKTHTATEDAIKQKLMSGTPAPGGEGGNDLTVNKEKFDEMSVADKIKFKEEHPEEAKAFMGV